MAFVRWFPVTALALLGYFFAAVRSVTTGWDTAAVSFPLLCAFVGWLLGRAAHVATDRASIEDQGNDD